ncbi:MAG: hypothetical protein FWE74_02035 [Oscillospiraceae bacterium]|nr:hypothetical protein [Oscillospiraceae bacterium]
MLKSNEPKKKISITLEPRQYKALAYFAISENCRISSAAKMIIIRILREFHKDDKL